ncbi:STAS domain-containing protein [Actinoplanes sp. G11-F43]|uniref:STAS domain-containing protein n=1 Tax=Actinoplanes sp. G11-F43 TaxID=3424130 RepID=UPI003D336D43
MHVRRSETLDGCELVWADGEITVDGAIDQANAGTITERLCAAIITGAVTLVDFSRVTFFSAAGLHLLEAVAVAARAADAIVRVRCSAPVWLILDLCETAELPGLVLDRHPEPDGTW